MCYCLRALSSTDRELDASVKIAPPESNPDVPRCSGGGVLVAALLVLALGAPPAAALPENGQKFKDWVAHCEKTGEGKPVQCFICQDLVLKKKKQRVLLIRIAIPPTRDDPIAVLTLPLGISLPPGVSVRVDDGKPVRVRVERCVASGCIAGFPLNKELLAAFKAGSKAFVTIHDSRRKPATLPVSLSGFTAALTSLRK